MTFARVAAPEFDLALTLNCGQVFHWQPHRDGFAGAIGGEAVYVEQRGDELRANAAAKMVAPARTATAITIAIRRRLVEKSAPNMASPSFGRGPSCSREGTVGSCANPEPVRAIQHERNEGRGRL